MKKLQSPYSVPDFIRLIWSLFSTKIFFSKARLIRQPSRIRGFKFIKLGLNFTTGSYCRIEASANISNSYSLIFGDNVQINDKCHIAAVKSVIISDNVLIGSNVFISDHDHGEFSIESLRLPPSSRILISSPIYIGRNVWIGENVVILKGVKIGESSIIAAGAVVTKDMPSFSLIAGVPAKVIKVIN